MAQTKKAAVRTRILRSAFKLFARRGYAGTTLADIAVEAGVATGSLYVYFRSKMEILLAVYRPWLTVRLTRLERQVAAVRSPRARARAILLGLWRDIPREHNGFANNLMQALSTADTGEGYSRDLLRWCESRVTGMLAACLPAARRPLLRDEALAHLLLMAFDGFVIGRRFGGPVPRVEAVVERTCDLLLGPDSRDSPPRVPPSTRRLSRSPRSGSDRPS